MRDPQKNCNPVRRMLERQNDQMTNSGTRSADGFCIRVMESAQNM
eukprot:CAMPEP_0181200274 /NCGR_PEP_ID=MMETSP1096-20121128/17668_1 /TAXON_ID=156174 ORGANISM="Chrysochromulina ericina, Strain CCMP281" /NCGR_SAMPLE_ID=MMETSP1096 /ASSEMBLY_ACC=CAM_ASM_000453 /LENGTH=44 /DNA_ID= /DNA_START= /DNA_END= /DNA_ORIENTATION=